MSAERGSIAAKLAAGMAAGIVGLTLAIPLLAGAEAQGSCGDSLMPSGGDARRLGGLAGTGVRPADAKTVRAHSTYAGTRVTGGTFTSTAYGPPWGGTQGEGIATAGGLPIGGGAPEMYMVAVDPALIGLGQLVHIQPNPFGWEGPFFAADTGGAITGRRIDFYDWRGRASQLAWGVQEVTVTRAKAADAPVCGDGQQPGRARGIPDGSGELVIAPGANRPGTALTEPLLRVMRRAAEHFGEIVITTGSNHSRLTVNGNVSDHWAGNGADMGSVANGFPIGGARGTRLAASVYRAVGKTAAGAQALATSRQWVSVCWRTLRVQVGWLVAGHFDHVHVGVRPGC